MPGPAPKPDSQRRRRNLPLGGPETRIPRSARASRVPEWPLSRPSKRETVLWDRLWATPQSSQWEILEWTDAVARYVRLLTIAEGRKAPASVLMETRQMEDRLGLTPLALLRLRWKIVEDDQEALETPGNVVDVRERLRAIE